MADSKISALTANTTPALTDIIPMVDDPSGTPATQKVTLAVVDALFRSNNPVYVATATATVADSTTETTLAGSGVGSLTLAANTLSVGKSYQIKAYGVVSNTSTPNITIKAKFGSTVLASTGTVATVAATNAGWLLDVIVTCRTTGASGTVFTQGAFTYGVTRLPMATTAAVTVDTTGALAFNLTAQWGTQSSSNTISCTNLVITQLN